MTLALRIPTERGDDPTTTKDTATKMTPATNNTSHHCENQDETAKVIKIAAMVSTTTRTNRTAVRWVGIADARA